MRWRPANSRIHRGSTEMVLVLRWVAASTAGQDGVLSRCDQVNASTQASLFNPRHAVTRFSTPGPVLLVRPSVKSCMTLLFSHDCGSLRTTPPSDRNVGFE